MTEKKNESPVSKQKRSSTVKQKKATTGAWWKSTTIFEKPAQDKETKETPKVSAKKRGRPRKKAEPSDSHPAAYPTPEVSLPPAEGDKTDPTLADPAEAAEKQEKQSAPKTSRSKKRSPRKDRAADDGKQFTVDKEAESAGIGFEENAQLEMETSSSDEGSETEESANKPEKKKRSRKPGRKTKQGSAAGKENKPVAPSDTGDAEETQTADNDSEDLLTASDEETVEIDTASEEGTPESDTPTDSAQEQIKEETLSGKAPPKPVIKLLINADEPEECRLALLEDGRLESIHVATSTRTQTKNNIYKAKVVAIEPNLQAAFVDYGTEKNGFLPFSEIHPEYYKEEVSEKAQRYIDQHQWKKLSITDVMEKGREVLVQVVKEEVGKKGANMTTYLSLPGRCVVLMPGSDTTGISRKISGEEKRSQLRDIMVSMNIPEGIGWIVRTASNDITKTALGRDVSYLSKLWEDVKEKGQKLKGVGLIYQDHDHVLRFLREHFDPDIQEIMVDNKEALEQVSSFISLLPAKQRNIKCRLHKGARPIFNQYSIEDQIESIYQPKVNLPSGGSIVIDPTEALVAIDVNSGSTQKGQNFEETIFQANVEAAKELARQLRLRDLGGLIVVDFIDMRSKKNIREVEREVKAAMKRDKAKVDMSRISKFGLMQISRQKLGAPIEAGNYRVCTHCKGRGMVRSVETLALYYLRRIHTGASRKMVYQIDCRFPLDVAHYLLNNKRLEIKELESKYNTEVVITADPEYKPSDHDIVFQKAEKDEHAKKRS